MILCKTKHSSIDRFPISLDKEISVAFDGGNVTFDAGLLLIARLEERLGLIERIAACITDRRQQSKISYTYEEMVKQRVYQICCGYEDCNDANTLRKDPAFRMAVGTCPEKGADLSSQPTLSRFEDIVRRKELLTMGNAIIEHFIAQHKYQKVTRIILDADVTEDPTHGDNNSPSCCRFVVTNGLILKVGSYCAILKSTSYSITVNER